MVEKESDVVIRRSTGMSNATVAAIVISLITAAVLITFMIMSANQQNRESELMRQRDQAETTARMAQSNQQPQQQQPAPVVITPQPTPTTIPVPVPVPTPAPSAAPMSPSSGESAVSDASIEVEVNSRLMDDEELRAHPVEVKFAGGTVILSGEVPNDDLKTRAGKIARTIKEVRKVVNNITVVE